LLIVAAFSRRIPSADRNSVTTTSAPCARHRRRNGDSDTPAMGARYSGTSAATANGKAGRAGMGGKLRGTATRCNVAA
jgi:hypothetical protein